LQILVVVANKSEARKIDYESWDTPLPTHFDVPTLTDEFGNNYQFVRFGIAAETIFHTDQCAIYPKELLVDALTFEPPVAKAAKLFLKLPVSAFGETGQPLRFRIPLSDAKDGDPAKKGFKVW
jgi:hypothetical protein